jgi:hypothetical protein
MPSEVRETKSRKVLSQGLTPICPDPVTGRFLSNDPIGISGGLNQYVFCGNNPANRRDPMGLCHVDTSQSVANKVVNVSTPFSTPLQSQPHQDLSFVAAPPCSPDIPPLRSGTEDAQTFWLSQSYLPASWMTSPGQAPSPGVQALAAVQNVPIRAYGGSLLGQAGGATLGAGASSLWQATSPPTKVETLTYVAAALIKLNTALQGQVGQAMPVLKGTIMNAIHAAGEVFKGF